ncbi:MAG TPA: NADH-quinone oxidoreductase subunit M [Candidatus Manganitrophaceae bacterium]|nr:NADH-quinone oxidoreductase subunit M [Candidatus Manganitrophaceae bacterium]
MILVWLILIPLAGGLLGAAASRDGKDRARWISLIAVGIGFILSLVLWVRNTGRVMAFSTDRPVAWLEEIRFPWIPRFGIEFHLAMDGLSLLLIVLTFFLGILSVLASWNEIQERVGFFHFNLLWVLSGIVGVFLAVDLFLFYFAWELMLIPMTFLIAIWGHGRRLYAAIKFFIFTHIGGLLMLIAILALYLIHGRATGNYTFEYGDLIGTPMRPETARWIMLGFFASFAVKLPMFPFHPWLPDAHTEAPTAGSVVLAGLMLKTGAYGLLRFIFPFFPQAAREAAPYVMTLGVIGIIYGSFLAFSQTDLKRLVAYTSVSHLGFVLLGIFGWNVLGIQGAVMEMLAHGVSTGALFILVGQIQERTHTREIDRMGGLWSTMPRWSGAGFLFTMAAIGLPGLGNFIAEALVLLGTYRVSVGLTVAAAIGILVGTFYGMRLIQKVFQGPNRNDWALPDLQVREILILAPMIVAIVWLGIYPQPVFETFQTSLDILQRAAALTAVALRR